MDLETITRADFEAHKGSTFQMSVGAQRTLALELLETQPLPTRKGAKRDAFLLRFRATDGSGVPQGTYALDHATLGAFELFLVPAGPMLYDAVFS
jgi:hypothetical protein